MKTEEPKDPQLMRATESGNHFTAVILIASSDCKINEVGLSGVWWFSALVFRNHDLE